MFKSLGFFLTIFLTSNIFSGTTQDLGTLTVFGATSNFTQTTTALSINTSGSSIAAWYDEHGIFVTYRELPGNNWQPGVVFDSTDTPGTQQFQNTVAINANGDAAVVYSTDNNKNLYAVIYSATKKKFGDPVLVAKGDEFQFSSLSIGISDKNEVVITYNNGTNVFYFSGTLKNDGSIIFSKPISIFATSEQPTLGFINSSQSSMNGAGDIVVAIQMETEEGARYKNMLGLNRVNGTWNTATVLSSFTSPSSNAESYNFAINENGQAIICWSVSGTSKPNQLQTHLFSDGSWENSPQTINGVPTGTIDFTKNLSDTISISLNNNSEAIVCHATSDNTNGKDTVILYGDIQSGTVNWVKSSNPISNLPLAYAALNDDGQVILTTGSSNSNLDFFVGKLSTKSNSLILDWSPTPSYPTNSGKAPLIQGNPYQVAINNPASHKLATFVILGTQSTADHGIGGPTNIYNSGTEADTLFDRINTVNTMNPRQRGAP